VTDEASPLQAHTHTMPEGNSQCLGLDPSFREQRSLGRHIARHDPSLQPGRTSKGDLDPIHRLPPDATQFFKRQHNRKAITWSLSTTVSGKRLTRHSAQLMLHPLPHSTQSCSTVTQLWRPPRLSTYSHHGKTGNYRPARHQRHPVTTATRATTTLHPPC